MRSAQQVGVEVDDAAERELLPQPLLQLPLLNLSPRRNDGAVLASASHQGRANAPGVARSLEDEKTGAVVGLVTEGAEEDEERIDWGETYSQRSCI